MKPLDQEEYTPHEATEWLRCNEKAVLRMMERGELPARRHGKSYRIHRDDLEAFIERCERTNSWPGDRK